MTKQETAGDIASLLDIFNSNNNNNNNNNNSNND